MPKKVRKRDGKIVDFDEGRISAAIAKALAATNEGDGTLAEKLGGVVVERLEGIHGREGIPEVEEIQDLVEKVLIEQGYAKTAKAYILYRQKRAELRQAKIDALGRSYKANVSVNALKVLKERYLLKDESGRVTETPDDMFRRVAKNVAQADAYYGASADEVRKTEEEFFRMMFSLEFLPNSPTLMNAGTPLQMLSACFVLPVEDSMEGIFDAVKWAAMTHKAGGGTGFSFSRLRPKGDAVKSTHGIASGPVSFIKVFDAATEAVKQGSRRRGANMGILRVDHPDVLEFVSCKADMRSMQNFNVSIAVTDEFMKAVESDAEYELANPRTKKPAGRLKARDVWRAIVSEAWRNGDPGVIFLDAINRANPTPSLGQIEATNPCGEVPLLPFESCNLGSIDVSKFADGKDINWGKLAETVRLAVHFLDNVIDVNKFPLTQMAEMSKGNRKIGLGVMGFGDLLFELRVAYDSEQGIQLAEKLMAFISQEADKASEELAKKRSVFPNWEKSVFRQQGRRLRNAARTCIAPTGTIGMIADCSPGIEPVFALSFVKNVLEGQRLLYVNRHFEEAAKEGFYSEALMRGVAHEGGLKNMEGVPERARKVFVVSHEIAPEWHVRMQAAFQKHTDLAVSKTINFPATATAKEVEEAYMLAWKLGCKGITIYRYGSRESQVLTIPGSEKARVRVASDTFALKENAELCPECRSPLSISGGCASCNHCGASFCV